ncbi:hypothetical protein T484DRAFT_1767671, partial [Baffinella frigidus]
MRARNTLREQRWLVPVILAAALVLVCAPGAYAAKKTRRSRQCEDMSSEEAVIAAERFKIAGEVDSERDCWEQAIDEDEDAVHPLVKLGDLHHTAGRLEKSMDLLNRALLLEPRSSAAAASAGGVLYTMGRFQESVARFEAAVAAETAVACSAQTLNNLGLSYAALRNHAAAVRAYQTALRIVGGGAPRGGGAAPTAGKALSILLNRGNALVEAKAFDR